MKNSTGEYRVETLRPHHFETFRPQPIQEPELPEGWRDDMLATPGRAWAALGGGRTLALLGLCDYDEDFTLGWAVLAEGSQNHLAAITRSVVNVLDAEKKGVLIAVNKNWRAAQRWGAMLGFVKVKEIASVDGHDLWARSANQGRKEKR